MSRWLYPEEINKKGLEIFGYSLGKYISNSKGQGSSIVIGQDYRSYSTEVKYHLTKGLIDKWSQSNRCWFSFIANGILCPTSLRYR